MKTYRFIIGMLVLLFGQCSLAQTTLLDQYDVKQYILDLNISNTSTLISGNVTMIALVTAPVLDTAAIELASYTSSSSYRVVDSVWFNGIPSGFSHAGGLVTVPLAAAIPQGELFSLRIFYHANGAGCPQSLSNGIFRMNYMGIMHTFNTSQPVFSKFWWPCKDVMTDKADSLTFIITTDSTNRSGSNGVLTSVEYPGDGKARYQWKTRYPISTYLVSFAVGPLTEHIDEAFLSPGGDSLLLYNLLFPTSPYYPMHLAAIEKTKQLLNLYGALLGDYPFRAEKYGYCVIGMPAIGMEHQTMCMMGYESLDTTTTRFYDMLTHFMTAHELAHQWFGDAVICSTWNDAWLVDGFASYMEYVALQQLESQTSADAWMEDAHNEVLSRPGGSVWIPDSLVNNVVNLFDYRLVYKKGAAILHLLRYEINNDSLFFAVLKNYISTYQYGDASAEAFRQIAESVTGMDLSLFFDQWFYGSGYPLFDIKWVQLDDTLEILSRQTTSTAITPLFCTPFDLRIWYPGGDTTVRMFQEDNLATWSIPFNHPVDSMAFDPDRWLIQKHSVHLGTVERKSFPVFRVYPNPTSGLLYLETSPAFSGNMLAVRVFDLSGRLQFEQHLAGQTSLLDLSPLPPGIYVITLDGIPGSTRVKVVRE